MKKKPKYIIGIDLDDTVMDFNNSLHAFHNKKYGTNVAREDITSYGLDKVWGYTREVVDSRLLEFYFTNEHTETPAVLGSFDAIDLLKNSHELHLITARGDNIKVPTMNWIHKNFPNHFSSITLTNKVFGLPSKTSSKVDECRRLNVDIMIEDSFEQAIEISAFVKRVYLLDCPWNQGILPTNVTRVYLWTEIIEHLNLN